jgi:hypothetical protein
VEKLTDIARSEESDLGMGSRHNRAGRSLEKAQAFLEAGWLPSARASLYDLAAEDFEDPRAAEPLLDALRGSTGAELKATIWFLTRLPLNHRH